MSLMKTEPMRRHPLGWPAGSVRAVLAFGVLGLLWAIALRYIHFNTDEIAKPLPLVFIYLQYLMILILASFFAAHGSTIGLQVSSRSPLGLPRGSVRFLLLAGYLGLAAYLFKTEPNLELPTSRSYILLIGLLLTGFFAGHFLSGIMRVLGGGQVPAWYQDFQAWVSLLCMIGQAVLYVAYVMINPTVSEQNRLDLPTLQIVLTAMVGFYFGARS